MKRLLAIFVTIVMVATLFVPTMSVFAEGETDYADYIPGDMPTDLITTNWPFEGSTGNMSFGWSGGWGTEAQWVASKDFVCDATTYYGAMGTFIKPAKITEELELGTAYVFSAKIKKVGAEGTNPSFGIWFWKTEVVDGATQHYKTYPVENAAYGYVPGYEFEDYNATIVTPSHETGSIQLGLGMVTAKTGDILQLDWSEGIYFAKEQAYDISNDVVGNSKIFAGSSTTLDAKIVNQLGSTGTLDQTITFTALNADRTAKAEGFTFTTNGNGTVNVAVAETVAEGEYVLLAQSDIYEGFRKGAKIEVVSSAAFNDYEAGDMPANLLASGSGGYVTDNTNGYGVSFGWYSDYGKGLKWAAGQDISLSATSTNFSVAGANIAAKHLNGGEPLASNTGYVFSAKIRNCGPEGTNPTFQLYYTGSQGRCFSNEYGADGFAPGMEDEDYKISFNTGANTTGAVWYGFVSAKAGDAIYMSTVAGETYFGVETPFTINVNIEDNKVIAGGNTTVSTELLNQIGIPGGLTQNFDYAVLNSDRTAFVDGIEVTEGADSTATISVDDSVPSGDYVVVALAEDYSGVQKGVNFSVINTSDFEDKITAEKVNYVVDPDNINWFLDGNGHSGFGESKSDQYFTWKDSVDIASTQSIYYMAGASFLRANRGHLIEDAVWTVGDTFVYSVRLKNDTPEIDSAPLFGLSFGDRNNLNALVSFPVTNTEEYQTYTGYYKSVKDRTYLSVGFARPDSCIPHTATNAVINMDISNGGSLFVSKEAATEIVNEFAGDSEVLPGESTTVEARVLNQIGETGNLDQGISWFALNPERTEIAEGITITDNGDGTAEVLVDDDVSCGDYVILAMSDASDLRKGITLSVVNSKARVIYTELGAYDGKAFLHAGVNDAACNKIKFVIASYNTAANKLIDAKACDVTVAEAGWTTEIPESLEISTDGADIVRVFVWDAETLEPIKFEEDVRKFIILGTEE